MVFDGDVDEVLGYVGEGFDVFDDVIFVFG